MSKYVWLIAGGVMQIPMAEEIKSRDYKLFLTDGDPDAPCRDLADQFVLLDTYDVYGHLDLAQSMTQEPIAVLTVAADVGPTVSAVADELGLPAVAYEIAKRARNKVKMREAINADHPYWHELLYDDINPRVSWESRCRGAGISPYPCVIKPLERAGSRGISLITSPFQWPRAVRKAQLSDNSNNRTFIVEEYLQGPEIATDNFVLPDGEIRYANAVWRLFSKDHFGIEVGHLNPFELNQELRDKIKVVASRLGVDWGPLKVDFLCDYRYGWVVTETATRLSGGFDHMYAAQVSTGRNLTKFMLDMALGEDTNIRDLWNTKKKYAFTYAPTLEPGIVSKWNIPEHDWLEHTFVLSNEIVELENCSQRPLFYITQGNSPFQAYRRARQVEREMQVSYE